MNRKVKAVGMISGGLDSTLATKTLLEQGIEIVGVNFSTGFCLTDHHRAMNRPNRKGQPYRHEALRAGADFEIPVEIIDIADEYYTTVLRKPKYGYGSAMNPCIDCRIFMFSKARLFLDEVGADFLYTGEVLGQRPMSQHRKALRIIARESGMEGRVLRPLSAKLLEPTIPEKEGLVDRERLHAISGRSRKEQMRLAAEYGILDFPQPAGGCCYLVDRNFARRLSDAMAYNPAERIPAEEIALLKVGRHFRLATGAKVIVGRDEMENGFLSRYATGRWTLTAMGVQGPITLVEGKVSEEDLLTAARITARYSDGKAMASVPVRARSQGDTRLMDVEPIADGALLSWRL